MIRKHNQKESATRTFIYLHACARQDTAGHIYANAIFEYTTRQQIQAQSLSEIGRSSEAAEQYLHVVLGASAAITFAHVFPAWKLWRARMSRI